MKNTFHFMKKNFLPLSQPNRQITPISARPFRTFSAGVHEINPFRGLLGRRHIATGGGDAENFFHNYTKKKKEQIHKKSFYWVYFWKFVTLSFYIHQQSPFFTACHGRSTSFSFLVLYTFYLCTNFLHVALTTTIFSFFHFFFSCLSAFL